MKSQVNDLVAMRDIESLVDVMEEHDDWIVQLDAAEGWSLDRHNILFEGYMLDISPLEARLQVIDIENGKVTDLGIKGFSHSWVW